MLKYKILFIQHAIQRNILIRGQGWSLWNCMKARFTARPHIFHVSVTWRRRGLSVDREWNMTSLLSQWWGLLRLHLRNRCCLGNRRCWWCCTWRGADCCTTVLIFWVCALRFGSAFYNIWQPMMNKTFNILQYFINITQNTFHQINGYNWREGVIETVALLTELYCV